MVITRGYEGDSTVGKSDYEQNFFQHVAEMIDCFVRNLDLQFCFCDCRQLIFEDSEQ